MKIRRSLAPVVLAVVSAMAVPTHAHNLNTTATSIAFGVYADTGIFCSTDPRTAAGMPVNTMLGVMTLWDSYQSGTDTPLPNITVTLYRDGNADGTHWPSPAATVQSSIF